MLEQSPDEMLLNEDHRYGLARSLCNLLRKGTVMENCFSFLQGYEEQAWTTSRGKKVSSWSDHASVLLNTQTLFHGALM